MDRHQFHEQALATAQSPPRLAAGALTSMSDTELREHIHKVSQWLGTHYFVTPSARALSPRLDMTIAFNETSLPGAKTITAISGANGVGKSTFAHSWAHAYHRRKVAGLKLRNGFPQLDVRGGMADAVPVVWLNLQAQAKIAELDVQILNYLGRGLSGTIRDMTLRAVRALEDHRVSVLVIDDVHLLKLSKSSGRDVLDHLKHLNTELGEVGGSMVLIGANLESTDLVYDPQITARLQLHNLQPLGATTAQGRSRWKDTVADMEADLLPLLPHAKAGQLTQNAGALHDLTGGYVGELATMLKQATVAALLSRTGLIDLDLLRQLPVSYRAERATT